MEETRNLVDLLTRQSCVLQDTIAFTFLSESNSREENISFAQLHRDACAIAADLQGASARGERAVLLYPPGLEFVRAFFGCLYAGVVAVPAYAPHPAQPAKTLPRLRRIMRDSGARFALTTSEIAERLREEHSAVAQAEGLIWIASDLPGKDHRGWKRPDLRSDSVAMLQYTSGSTGDPKGVVLTHGNLLHNRRQIERGLGRPPAVGCSWLPVYHDMGLIGHVIVPVCQGIRSVIMAPLEFLRAPYLWLEAITRYRATTSGGPNFAWDLCTQKIAEERLANPKTSAK